jgi:hypothetical protein
MTRPRSERVRARDRRNRCWFEFSEWLRAPSRYRRLKPRRGHKRAPGAVKHTTLVAIWHMLATGETYRELGGD